jgi:hypothetical protein
VVAVQTTGFEGVTFYDETLIEGHVEWRETM